MLVRKQYENSEDNIALLEKRVKELVTQLDATRNQCSQVSQERDALYKSVEALRADKNALERNRSVNGIQSPFV